MASFQDSIRANIAKLKIEADAKLTGVFKELATTVVGATPILRGNLVNDFWPAVNQYDYTTNTPVWKSAGDSQISEHTDKTGSGSLKRIKDVPLGTFLVKDGFISLTVSAPVAYRIEYLGWSSSKAPTGFIRNSLTEVAAKYR